MRLVGLKQCSLKIGSNKQRDFDLIQNLVRSIRNWRAETKIEARKKLEARILGGSQNPLLQSQARLLSELAGLDFEKLSFIEERPAHAHEMAVIVVEDVEIFLREEVRAVKDWIKNVCKKSLPKQKAR